MKLVLPICFVRFHSVYLTSIRKRSSIVISSPRTFYWIPEVIQKSVILDWLQQYLWFYNSNREHTMPAAVIHCIALKLKSLELIFILHQNWRKDRQNHFTHTKATFIRLGWYFLKCAIHRSKLAWKGIMF